MRIESESAKATSYADFVKTKGNRWRLAIIISLGVISQYSGNALFSNYMNTIYGGAGITDQNQKLAVRACLSKLNISRSLTAHFLVAQHGSNNSQLDHHYLFSSFHQQSWSPASILGSYHW